MELASGAGDTKNVLFDDGRKWFAHYATAFGYELNSSQSIRVRVKDEHDALVEGIFLVAVTDLTTDLKAFLQYDLNIAENQPVGSPVGEFNAVDQDANATLLYELVNGSGGSDNGLFTLESNGTLRTALPRSISKQCIDLFDIGEAMDEHNSSIDGNFTVNLLT